MRTPRAVTTGAVLALLMTLAFSATAAAGNVPRGQGLSNFAAVGITNLVCTDPTIGTEDVILPRGHGATASWVIDGRMYLLGSIAVVGTVTTPEGTFPVEFSQSYGQKTGLANGDVTCTFDQSFEEGAVTFEASGTAVLVRVR